jgi:hypothetical protein
MELVIPHTISEDYIKRSIANFDGYRQRETISYTESEFAFYLSQEYTRAVFDNGQVLYFHNKEFTNPQLQPVEAGTILPPADYNIANGRIDSLPEINVDDAVVRREVNGNCIK